MLVVYLFVTYAHVNRVTFSLPPGVGGWLRLLLVASWTFLFNFFDT